MTSETKTLIELGDIAGIELECPEMRELFGDLPESERAIVCDDCHQELLAWLNRPGVTAN
jgi:hypothetical protein